MLIPLTLTQAQETDIYTSPDANLSFPVLEGWAISGEGTAFLQVASHPDLLGGNTGQGDDFILNIIYSENQAAADIFADFDLSPSRPLAEIAAEIGAELVPDPSALTETTVETTPTITAPMGPGMDLYIGRNPQAGIVIVLAGLGETTTDTYGDALNATLAALLGGNTPLAPEPSQEEPAQPAEADLAAFINTPTVLPGGIEEPENCDGLQLGRASSLPTQEIELIGIPADILESETNEAVVRFPDGTEQAVLLFRYVDEIRSFNVPLHPDIYGGGAATLHIIDSDSNDLCPPQPFTIEGLPDTPGTFEQMVEDTGRVLADQREAAGVTAEFLRPSNPAPLPPELYGLALAQYGYDDPDNPNSLVNMAAGTAPIMQQSDVDMRLLNGILAAGLIEEHQQQSLQRLSAGHTPYRRLYSRDNARPLPRPQPQGSVYNQGRVVINNLDQLRDAMERQHIAQTWLGGDSYTGQMYNDAALVNSLAGAAFVNPVAAGVTALISAVMYVNKLAWDAEIHLLPNRITDFEATYTDRISNEDNDNLYTFEAFTVSAASKSWDLSYTLVDGVLVVAGSASALDDVAKASADSARTFDVAFSDGLGNAQSTGEVTSNLSSRVAGQEGTFTIPSYTWEDIPVTFDEFSEVKILSAPGSGEHAVRIVDDFGGRYTALNQNRSLFRFDLDIADRLWQFSLPVEVGRIDVDLTPNDITIQEGEQICFEGNVENAIDPSTTLTIEGPQVNETITFSNTPIEYCFNAPARIATEWSDPVTCADEAVLIPEVYVLGLESTSDTGARNPDTNASWEARFDLATIAVEAREDDTRQRPERPECEIPRGPWQFINDPSASASCGNTDYAPRLTDANIVATDGYNNIALANRIEVQTAERTIPFRRTGDRNTPIFEASEQFSTDGFTLIIEYQLLLYEDETATIIMFGEAPSLGSPQVEELLSDCRMDNGNFDLFVMWFDGTYIGE